MLGTTVCWFLLDIAFYGINLNQNVVLQQIHFDGKSGSPWNRLFKIATGNLIITALGFVPGYYVTVLTIEKLGRKWIQTQGFLLEALFCTSSALCCTLRSSFVDTSTVPFSGYPRWQVQLTQHRCVHRQLCSPPILLQLWRQRHHLRAFPISYPSMFPSTLTLTCLNDIDIPR